MNYAKTSRQPKGWLLRMLQWYGGKCHLCGHCMDIFADRQNGGEPLGPSRDHRKPVSAGANRGSRYLLTRDPNQWLAHRYCNSQRSSREITDELREELRVAVEQKFGLARLEELRINYLKWKGVMKHAA